MYALIKYQTTLTYEGQGRSAQVIPLTQRNIGITSGALKRLDGLEDKEGISYVEKEFALELGGRFIQPTISLDKETLVGYIGKCAIQGDKNSYYDLDTQTLVDRQSRYVIGFSKKQEITSTQYLRFIIEMIEKSLQENKKLLIYADIYIKEEKVRYRSLLNKVVNQLLEQVNGILVQKSYGEIMRYYTPSSSRFESYIEKTIYTEDSFSQMIRKMNRIKDRHSYRNSLKRLYRQVDVAEKKQLYNNIFYEQILPTEQIYVPISPTSIIPKEVYESLGVDYVKVDRGYGLLRGEKQIFDKERDFLIDNVIPKYDIQILTPVELVEVELPSNYTFNPGEPQDYNGEGVYIGIIGVNGIDYRDDNFIDEQGTSRIAYVWEQLEGGRGREYSQDDIQKALKNNTDLEIYSKNESYLTSNLLAIAGGKTKFEKMEYKGVASEAEFVVAKIDRASDELQRIYVGVPTDDAVLLDDIIIAINKLVKFANKQKRPLVLCIPYGSNLNSHDGKSILETRIETFANQPGITMIVSAGEEADKAHHSRIRVEKDQDYTVNIEINGEQQKVVGAIWIDDINLVEMRLISPSKQSYNLNKKGRYIENSSEILISGIGVDFDNGLKEIMFSIENITIGRWEIYIKERDSSEQGVYENIIDIWLSQQALNNHVTLYPNDVFVTIPGIGNIPNVLSVGNYDNDTLTIYKSSGRGYTRQNLVKPTLVAQGKNVLSIIREKNWGLVTGSAASMANMAGVVAALYSRLLRNQVQPLPNTSVMSSILISQLTLLETVEYPNPSQGNGIFDRRALKKLLSKKNQMNL